MPTLVPILLMTRLNSFGSSFWNLLLFLDPNSLNRVNSLIHYFTPGLNYFLISYSKVL